MLPKADLERFEREQDNKEFDKISRDRALEIIVASSSPERIEILYALSCAAKRTTESVTPQRLIEIAGIYHPPNSTTYITAHLEDLSDNLFVYKEGDAYKISDFGESAIRFWDDLSKCAVDFDILKDKMPPTYRRMIEKSPKGSKLMIKEITRRIKRVDEHFQRGI